MRSLGQVPLVIVAMAIFSTIQLSVNASIIQSFAVSIDSEASINGLSIGQTMLSEIMKKEFDNATIDNRVYDRAELTPVASFGPDSGEVITTPDMGSFASDTTYDDIDDYNRYTRIVPDERLGDFVVVDSIRYVQEANQDLGSSSQTWYKEVIVTVSNDYLSAPVKVKSLTVYRRFF